MRIQSHEAYLYQLFRNQDDRIIVNCDFNQKKKDRKFATREAAEAVTVQWGDEVDVTVTEGATGGGVAADSNGCEALELREVVEYLTVGDVRVEVADVQ